ncbi:MAG: NAD(+) diphosphatase [Polyangiaceae bacterium]|nr:NAD(+) diphosphatase [Polyangiaceae bacterium]
MTPPRFRPGLERPAEHADIAWFAYRGGDLLVRDPGGGRPYEVPVARDLGALGVRAVRTQPLGELDGVPCCSAELAGDAAAPEGHALLSLRRLHGRMDAGAFDAAGTAFQIQYWDRTNQYCGTCGGALEARARERAKHCAACDHDVFPRVTPATITLIHDGPRILMTRQPRFPPDMYGLVAGFLEPGEALEACVAREAREETGIEVADITYFGSQPWPFPHQIMIGFTARRAGGELRVDTTELEDARWFHRDAMPPLPPPISIARRLIDAWLAAPPR